jgi:sigma-B regulation protein RsbU (phosphoserine phosphatase)
MKVLMIEDDPVAGAVLQAALRALGHEVAVATNGAEAWTAFRQDPRRLVISDWMLPGIDGLELCRRIRQRGGDYTYFILLSNLSASGDNLDQAMAAGVDDFLAKPVKATELKARLHVAERILGYATQVQQLESFIPICSYCKKVRDDKNYWSQIESYINSRTGSSFSHGVCPDCYTDVIGPQMRELGIEPPPYGGKPAGPA